MYTLNANKEELQQYFTQQGWLKPEETVLDAGVPGAGNMNFTLRITTSLRSFIVKQSRAYVEKYPQVAAPAERALREAEFYDLISIRPQLARYMPQLLRVDQANNVLMMQDLGEGADYTFLYREGSTLSRAEAIELMEFLAALHRGFTVDMVEKPIVNREMRKLNHEHIYVYPYLENNGLNLDDVLPGLQEVSVGYKTDEPLKAKARSLGEQYLRDGEKLLHGDYFPGSWLKTAEGIRIIDPEFCFFGPTEFELGTCLAHLKMADQDADLIDLALQTYKANAPIDEGRCKAFMGAEILRRILGLAQLPLEIDLEKRKVLLAEARQLLLAY
jgi:5-methylthioribose kinase